jgi:purine-binding chemotaxis protein CheW
MAEPIRALADEEEEARQNSESHLHGVAGHFLAFRIGDRRLAFPLEKVERVIRMAALVPVPEAPEWISGLLNLHGVVMPVISLRSRLELSRKEAHPDDRILVIQTAQRKLGVIAETVEEVVAVPEETLTKPEGTARDAPLLSAIIQKNDEVYLVLEANEIDTGEHLAFEAFES